MAMTRPVVGSAPRAPGARPRAGGAAGAAAAAAELPAIDGDATAKTRPVVGSRASRARQNAGVAPPARSGSAPGAVTFRS